MAYLSPDCRMDFDDGFIEHLNAFSKASSNFLVRSPATPATLESHSSSKAYMETPPLFEDKPGKAVDRLAEAAFAQSPDESIYFVYGDDEKLRQEQAKQRPLRQDHIVDNEIEQFTASRDDFGDFSEDPLPKNLSELVDQFAKIIEAEDQFVQMYKQCFLLNPNHTRKTLEAKGFKFQKAKMVSMLSSKVLRESVLEEDEQEEEEHTLIDPDEKDLSRYCFNSSSHLQQQDDLSVVMSICTNHTGQTGTTDATSVTAARLMSRLMDPKDHDSVVSKELRKLSPSELAARFVEMQTKLREKHEKKIKKKKKSKEQKKKKKKRKKHSDGSKAEGGQRGNGQEGKPISQKPSPKSSVASEIDRGTSLAPVQPKSILRKTDDYFAEYRTDPGKSGSTTIPPFPLTLGSTATPLTKPSTSNESINMQLADCRARGRSPGGRRDNPKSETMADIPRRFRRNVWSLPPRSSTKTSGRNNVDETTNDDLKAGSSASKPFWNNLLRQGSRKSHR